MSNIMMHVFLNDTHLLSLSPGPIGDISIHASVAAHDTTLDNSKHRGARYDPQNDTSLYHNHVSDTMQLTCSKENEEITILIPQIVLNTTQGNTRILYA